MNFSISEWYEDHRLIQVDAYAISTKSYIRSQRPILLLLHGFPTCSIDWYMVWDKLKENFDLITFDFLGYGRSAKPYPHQYTISEQADITEAVLRNCNCKELIILGHDYGVSVAQELLSRQNEGNNKFGIKGIIFLNGGLFAETHRPRPIQKLLLSPFGKIINQFISKKVFKKSFTKVFGSRRPPTDEEINGFWALLNENKGKRVFHLLIKYIQDRQVNRDRWVLAMQQTKVPMLLVNGPADPVSGRHLVERYCELIPNPEYQILEEDIGHYPQVEASEQVLKIIFPFIEKYWNEKVN